MTHVQAKDKTSGAFPNINAVTRADGNTALAVDVASDIQIGAVELKAPTSDTRVDVVTRADTKNALCVDVSSDIELGKIEIKDATTDTTATVETRGAKGTLAVEVLDAAGNQIVAFGADPVGLKNVAAATINPATEDSLSSLNGKVTACNTGAVVVASGAITEANSGTIAGDTTSIDGKITACNTGAVVVSSGAITETNSSTIAGDTTSIDGKITACNTGAVVVASGAITETNSSTIAGDTTSIDGKITACNTGAVVVASGAITETNSGTISSTATAINNKLVSGTDIGDVTVNNAVGEGVYVRPGTSAVFQTQSNSANIATESSLSSLNGKVTACNTGAIVGSVTANQTTASSLKAEAHLYDSSTNGIGSTSNALDINIKSGSVANTAFGCNNAAGASAVNIQDGGNTITVDGTVNATCSGTVSANCTQTTSPWVISGAVTNSALTDVWDGTHHALQVGVIGTMNLPVVGTVADGVAPNANPVLIAGQDGTLTQSIKTDASGELQVDVLTLPAVTGTVSANCSQTTSPWVISGAVTTDALKAANTLTKVSTVDTITNAVTAAQGTAASLKSEAHLYDSSTNGIGSTSNALDINIKSGGISNTSFISKAGAITNTVTSQDLSAGALSLTTAIAAPFRLVGVLLHAASAITQTVTVTFDSGDGANYDTVLSTSSLAAATDYFFQPSYSLLCKSGSEIKVACTNSGTPAVTVYATIITEAM